MKSIVYVFRAILWRRLTSLFLLGAIFLLWFLLGGLLLAGVGAPFQFWHDDFIKRMIAELTVGGFVGVWTLTCYLIDHGKAENLGEGKFGVRIPHDVSFMEDRVKAYFFQGLFAQIKVGFAVCIILGLSGFSFTANVELSNNFQSPITFVIFATSWILIGFTLFILLQWLAFCFMRHKFELPILGPFFNWLNSVLGRMFEKCWNTDNKANREIIPAMEELFHRIAFYSQMGLSFVLVVRLITYWIGTLTAPSYVLVDVDLTAGAYICILLSIATGIYGYLVYQRTLHKSSSFARNSFNVVQLVIILIALTAYFFPLESQPVRNLRDAKYETIEQWYSAAERTNNTKEGLPKDFSYSSEKLKKRPLVIIANSGGGIKAQVWSTIVLNALEQRIYKERDQIKDPEGGKLAPHIRYITGTSGGMVGAAYWTATLGPPDQFGSSDRLVSHWMYVNNNLNNADELSAEKMISQMCADGLTPVTRQGFSNDLLGSPFNFAVERLSQVSPWFNRFKLDSRGRALEYTWESPYWFDPTTQTGISAYAQNFRELGKHEKPEGFEETPRVLDDGTRILPTDQKWRPSLMMAPAVAENGRRFLISNADVDYLLVSSLGDEHYSISGYSWKSYFPEDDSREDGFKLSTASRLNANFPLIIDSPTIPLKPKLHLMDAGYYDNYGVTLATEWLIRNHKMVKEMYSGVLFVQIAAAPLPRAVNGVEKTLQSPEVPGFVTSSFNKTIYNTDSMIAHLNHTFNELPQDAVSPNFVNPDTGAATKKQDDFFQFVTFEYAGPASLSWYVSRTEIYSLIFPLLSDGQIRNAMERCKVNDKTKDFVDSTLAIDVAGDLFSIDEFPQVFRDDIFNKNSMLEKPGEQIFFRQLDEEMSKSDKKDSKTSIKERFRSIKTKLTEKLKAENLMAVEEEEVGDKLAQAREIQQALNQDEILDSKAETRLQQLVISRVKIQNHLNLVASWWAKRYSLEDNK